MVRLQVPPSKIIPAANYYQVWSTVDFSATCRLEVTVCRHLLSVELVFE
ncbi:hypothetical protein SAMN05216266_109121 [Amycolatopsis marina]|uniref:Uncharacterized protein n=1 Tax=Amycolatopsis marina TaxID=490629 RepID=A0A1I1AHZ0_9PSEU|nr:hypothetical protein SAMN05216266_109121 [Amycolatopsis marina]